jgi:hypothetical protein
MVCLASAILLFRCCLQMTLQTNWDFQQHPIPRFCPEPRVGPRNLKRTHHS